MKNDHKAEVSGTTSAAISYFRPLIFIMTRKLEWQNGEKQYQLARFYKSPE
jgi:hypothetical protein